MTTTEPIVIPIDGDPRDFIADAKKIQDEMDMLAHRLQKAGVSQSAYNTAVANNKKLLDQQTAATKQSSMSLTDIRSAYQMAADAVRVIGQAYEATIGKAQEYDQSIRDVMLSTGASAEEASRLVQVIDDTGVSYSTLKTALKMASKEGIEPNIQSLAALSDEYLKLAPGVERNQFLLDKFGKSGLDMARAMELGGDALLEMNSGIKGGLVLTQEAIDESEEYRKNIDELTDSWDAFVVTVGNKGIPVLNDVIDGYKVFSDIMDEANKKMESGENTYRRAAIAQAAVEEQLRLNTDATDSATDSYTAWAETVSGIVIPTEEDNAEAIKHMTDVNREYLSLIGDVTKEYESQSDKLAGLNDDHAKLLEEKQKLMDQGWSEESEKIQDVNGKIDENRDKYADATTEFELNAKRRILAMVEEQLSVDGLTAQEQEALLNKGLAWGVYSQQAVDAMREAYREAQLLTDAINTIPSERTFTMSVRVQGAENVGGLGAGFGASQWQGRASGGSVTGGTPYIVGEKGPEMFVPSSSGNIIPNNKLSSSGVTVNIMLDSATPDPERVAYNLAPAIKRVLRQEGLQ